MSRYIVDAWAWIEYFRGSKSGSKLNEILEDPTTDVYVSAITIAEVTSKLARDGIDVEAAYDILLSNSQVIKVDEQISKQAGFLHSEMRQTIKDFGVADALVLATANKLGAKIITGDPHFKGLENAIMIK